MSLPKLQILSIHNPAQCCSYGPISNTFLSHPVGHLPTSCSSGSAAHFCRGGPVPKSFNHMGPQESTDCALFSGASQGHLPASEVSAEHPLVLDMVANQCRCSPSELPELANRTLQKTQIHHGPTAVHWRLNFKWASLAGSADSSLCVAWMFILYL